mmetsp:Transcript_13569/g.44227  ORF Transcript_13569/g.44227 Transcript_13569/m.44227 type:complete len:292 (-) Transcript_13569:177-1052(-)
MDGVGAGPPRVRRVAVAAREPFVRRRRPRRPRRRGRPVPRDDERPPRRPLPRRHPRGGDRRASGGQRGAPRPSAVGRDVRDSFLSVVGRRQMRPAEGAILLLLPLAAQKEDVLARGGGVACAGVSRFVVRPLLSGVPATEALALLGANRRRPHPPRPRRLGPPPLLRLRRRLVPQRRRNSPPLDGETRRPASPRFPRRRRRRRRSGVLEELLPRPPATQKQQGQEVRRHGWRPPLLRRSRTGKRIPPHPLVAQHRLLRGGQRTSHRLGLGRGHRHLFRLRKTKKSIVIITR